MKKLALAIALGLSFALPLHAETPAELLVTVNTGNPQTQGMAFALASRAVFGEKVAVRVLLCSEGGKLAIKLIDLRLSSKPDHLPAEQRVETGRLGRRHHGGQSGRDCRPSVEAAGQDADVLTGWGAPGAAPA